LAEGGVVIEVEARFGELEGERPDGFVVINVVRLAENAPEVGELEARELHFDEVFGFFIAEESVGGGIVEKDVVERLERRSEAMVSLDDDSLLVGSEDDELLSSMFNDGDIALGVGNKEILGDSARGALKDVEGLAGGAAVFDDITDEVRGREAVTPLVDMGVGEADIKAVLINAVFGIELASVLAEVAAPDAFVGEEEVAVGSGESELVLLEEFAGGGLPVVVAADEGFTFLVKSENSTTVSVLMDTTLLMIDERGEVFVEEKVRV